MEDNISKWYHEQAMSRMERTNKRLWILCIILLAMLMITNIGWIYYENQFQDMVIEQEAEADSGGTALVNNGGDLNYGTSEADDKN